MTHAQVIEIAQRFEKAAKTLEAEGKEQRTAGTKMANAAEELARYAKTLEFRGEDLQRLADVCRGLSSYVLNEIKE